MEPVLLPPRPDLDEDALLERIRAPGVVESKELSRAALMLYTGRRLKGVEAVEIGLADELVEPADVRSRALELATEIAQSAPLAVQSIRATLRRGLAEAVREATDHELAEQSRLRRTDDHREGVAATAERRLANFRGR